MFEDEGLSYCERITGREGWLAPALAQKQYVPGKRSGGKPPFPTASLRIYRVTAGDTLQAVETL
ncbi:MAG: hypothetical protein DMF60_03860 [Acidobacteria bacterium]|nr:MAG: hypothetical protein DMF60_03860 [Acidobacteriota bacterium]